VIFTRTIHLYVARAIIMVLCFAPPAAHGKQLLSFREFPLAPDDSIDQFKIETLGIRVVSVCNIPWGWSIITRSRANEFGYIEGTASNGITRIDRDHLGLLDDLFLIEDAGQIRDTTSADGNVPKSFDGQIFIVGRDDEEGKPHPMQPRNYVLRHASACPPRRRG